ASAFYSPADARLVTVGNTEDHFDRLAQADWIVEAVFERLDVKQSTYEPIEKVRKATSIVSSNTSGIPAKQLMEGRDAGLRQHFLITHFFNPVRFLKLLELVPDVDTDPEVVAFMGQFGTNVLGKGTVVCKDTPGFIANRLGNYGMLATLHRVLDEGYGFDQADAILGVPMGRPKSAVFGTADIAGIDILVDVADGLYRNLPDDPFRESFQLPEFVRTMLANKWLGNKTGQGFYRRTKGAGGKRDIAVLDPATLDYRPSEKVAFPSLSAAKEQDDPFERIRTVINGSDRASKLAWESTADSLIYAATIGPDITDDVRNVDNAMKWGFNSEVGPFETWDALGVEATARRMQSEGRTVPPLVQMVLGNGQGKFYAEAPARSYFDFRTSNYVARPATDNLITAKALHAGNKVVKENKSASLLDMGDGIMLLEFHTKLNALDDDIFKLLRESVEEAKTWGRALVIGNDSDTFSAGANLVQAVMASKMRQWKLLEGKIKGFQDANMALKYADIPVVVAPAGRALGGGCEIIMHGHHVRAAAEAYIGLVEVGVGLIPGGGGCKEMLARWSKGTPDKGPFAAARHAFEIIAVATVSTSAREAQGLRYLTKTAAISFDRERLLLDAKADAIALAEAAARGEWQKPTPATFRLGGTGERLVLKQNAQNLQLQGKVSEHDVLVADQLARVLTGGDCQPTQELTEQDILDLEREAFLFLLGTAKTQERIQYTLTTGQPLRN
ncbi:MAG: 3-hydroxyacyl-CoA dehydrogenase/enoyl-CoA hydratase family protein, partial [Ktedonobacterales bacterium]|nr:3-hydroxyacyl-CoA dehydrogenase/enoyl-CoA hydratase family protein [Ktedonobacterales bacterium]